MRTHPRSFVFVPLLTATVLVSSCDEGLTTLSGPTPGLEPTFSSIQRDVFEATDRQGRSACISCHTSTGRNPAAGLNLSHDTAYDHLINIAARGKPGVMRVTPGSPDASYLVHKLAGTPAIAGSRMPAGGPPYLTDGQILIIRRWIAVGAPRN